MKKNMVILVAFAFIIVAVICFQYLPGKGPGSVINIAAEPAKPSEAGEFRGICLQLHNSDKGHPYEKYIDEIARSGANTICLVIHGYQENAASTSIFIDSRKTMDNNRLAELIRRAQAKKLRVIIMPVVLLTKRRGNEWRGKIKPDNWDQWWHDYTEFIMHYAKLAGETKVELLAVGSELISTETQTSRWKQLIAKVRSVFPGRLTYSANWDHYQVPKFWDDLDIIGMTTYFTLAKGTSPTQKELLANWAEIKKKILAWQKTINRPILFTEVGWPNQETAAEFPWNYYAATDKPAPQLQADCFESFFQTWANEKAVAGFLVWEWRNHPNQKIGPKEDTSYCPCGKPAMGVIQKYFLMPDTLAR